MTSKHKLNEWGLTGNIGSGKSTVARWLAEKGAVIIDADALAKAATEDEAILARIAAELGEDLLEEGKLNRYATAARVFNDETALRTLNGIIHPWVAAAREARRAELRAQDPAPKVVIHDIPLLFETGLEKDLHNIIVVASPFPVRKKRVMSRSSMTSQEFAQRDGAQIPLEDKIKQATIVIDNSGSLEDLGMQLEAMWSKLRSHSRYL